MSDPVRQPRAIVDLDPRADEYKAVSVSLETIGYALEFDTILDGNDILSHLYQSGISNDSLLLDKVNDEGIIRELEDYLNSVGRLMLNRSDGLRRYLIVPGYKAMEADVRADSIIDSYVRYTRSTKLTKSIGGITEGSTVKFCSSYANGSGYLVSVIHAGKRQDFNFDSPHDAMQYGFRL